MTVNFKMRRINENVDPTIFGWKAYWLSWLEKEGYNVPPAIFISAVAEKDKYELTEKLKETISSKTLILFRDGLKYSLAVRSSATIEDTMQTSMAGQFKTYLGQMTRFEVIESIIKVIKSLGEYGDRFNSKMGVILQRRIKPIYSGVLFSSNPLNALKDEMIVSLIRGSGEELVSGKKEGEDIRVSFEKGILKIDGHTSDIDNDSLIKICSIGKEIELKLGFPVDIEWCLEERTMKLYLLQVRPATGIQLKFDKVIPINSKNEKLFPPQIFDEPKVSLRITAEREGIIISPASLVPFACTTQPSIPDLSSITPSEFCSSLSVVLIYPKRIDGKILRYFQKFSEDSTILKLAIGGCERYQVREYPKTSTLKDTILHIEELCRTHSWIGIVIVQEIFDAEFTGVLIQISDGYAIEFTFGHFITKGLNSISRYITDKEGNVVTKKEVYQSSRLKIYQGHIIEEKIPKEDSLVYISDDLTKQLIREFCSLFDNGGKSVEFGIIRHSSQDFKGKLMPYLIDFVDDPEGRNLKSTELLNGILSRGKIQGKLVNLTKESIKKDAFNFHYLDLEHTESKSSEPIIYVCDKPYISLLTIVNEHQSGTVGFIFRDGSLLCHLAITLRERRIPAIILEDQMILKEGKVIELDASTPNLASEQRVRYVN
jgi:hypothetical protein